jgi:hypothetical protein
VDDQDMNNPLLLAALFLAPAAPHPPQPTTVAAAPAYGTLSVCAATGTRPVAGPLTFTLGAAAGAGGTQTMSLAIGKCSAAIFYPSGTVVTILENVPAGAAVTTIGATGAGTLSAISPVAGSATFTVGNAPGTITFTTNAAAATSTAPADCTVPNLKGLLLATAKTRVRSRGCTVGAIRRKYSSVYVAGRVFGQSPARGAVVAHGAPVDIIVSRGRA